MSRPKVLLLRGYNANPWDLRPWEALKDEFEIAFLEPHGNLFDTSLLELDRKRVVTRRDLMPPGRIGDIAGHLLGDRYLAITRHLADADIVHAAELGFWFSAQAARLKGRFRYRLALTVWETLPFLETYRSPVRTRNYRRCVIEATDLYLPTTERARDTLLLEGVPAAKIKVSPPGIDLERFGVRAVSAPQSRAQSNHLVISVGRLVWEKGHQDVLRAFAALHRKLIVAPAMPRLLIVGSGPQRARLKAYAEEFGVSDYVRFEANIPYDEMPEVYGRASCLVLASLSIPKWEEQFGMVVAEAMAARLPIIASSSGAIPEVVGDSGTYFVPGDWLGLAKALAAGPLSKPPGSRCELATERVQRLSARAAAARLRDAYHQLLETRAD